MASIVSGVIENINVGGTSHAIASTAYGYCTTAANESAKTVEMTDFKLEQGVTIHIKFQYDNTALTPTLNVNSTGAKPIALGGSKVDVDGGIVGWRAGDIVTFTYDGDNRWVINNSAYATMAGSILSGNIHPTIVKEWTDSSFYGANITGQDVHDLSTFWMLSVRPDEWYKPWTVRFKITTTCPAAANYQSITYSTYSGRADSYIVSNWVERYDHAHYYTNIRTLKKAGFDAGLGHAIGINLYASNNYTNANYYRSFKLEYYDCDNCTVTILENPIKWANWENNSSTYYNGNSNADAVNRGLRESGDDNTITRLYMGNNYFVNGSTLRLPGYTIFGLDSNNHTQTISLYHSTYADNTISINTARVYNTAGFNWQKGLYYNTNGNYAVGADVNISIDIGTHAIDFRYTDNCVAATSATTLGLVGRKPVYLRGIIDTDGLFYIRPIEVTYNNVTYKRAWTQDEPTDADGYVYWFLGYPYYNSTYPSGYQLNFYPENKLFWYHNGAFQEYVPHAESADGVKQIGTTTTGEYPVLFKNTGDTTDETASVKYSNGNNATATANLAFTFNPNTGNLTIPELTIAKKDDNYGIFPHTSNYNQIGKSNLYWYRAYITNYYGTTSHITNWDSGKNIGTEKTSSAAATKGSVNFYNVCAAGGTTTKTTLAANDSTNSNITINLPSTSGTLALVGAAPTAHEHNYLTSRATINSGDVSNNDFKSAIRKYFDDNYSTVPRNALVNFYSNAYSNGSEVFGYYLSGYNDNPHGGFFIAHYDTPRYVGLINGSSTEAKLARIDIANTITTNQVMIADGSDGKIKTSGYTIAKSVPSNAVFTDHYAWGDITGRPTKITLTGAVTGNVSLGEGELTLSTSVNHNHNSSYLTAVGYDTTNKKIYYTKNGSNIDVVTAATLRTDMGLSNALHFIGITSTTLTDGSTTSTLAVKTTGSLSKTTGFVDGDVVMDGDQLREYVWSGSAWRLLGITTSTAYSQTATGNSWIASITQGTDGKITATTGSLVTTGEWSGNAGTATTLKTARTIWGQSFNGSANVTGNLIDVGNQIKLLSGNSELQFLTSSGGAANGKFGKLGLNTTYANVDFTNYILDVNGKTRIGALDGGQHVINGNVQLNSQSGSYNEGLRINRSTTGYANIYLGGTRSSASGNQTGGWWIGTLSTPADATSNGDTITNTVFTISNNSTADTFSIKGTRGATIGTNSGWTIKPRVGIGVAFDTNYSLKVTGKTLLNGALYVGASDTAGTESGQNGYVVNNSGSNNYIAFYGVNGDNPGSFNHTYIGESIYGSKTTTNEQSELLLFHGNDPGSGSGPDRIRLFAGEVDIQVYTAATSGTWDTIRATTGTQVVNFKKDLVTVSGNIVPDGTRTLGTSTTKWNNVYATTFTGNLTGNVTGNCSGSAGSVAWANTGHPDTFPPTIGNTATTAMAGNTTVTNVSYTSASDDAQYPILMKNSTGATTTAAGTKFNTGVTINPSTSSVTATEFIGNIKADKIIPIITKTYTNVIATVNASGNVDQETGGFFYAKVRGLTYDSIWHTKFRITASVPGNNNFYATSIYDLWGFANTYSAYKCQNAIRNTSYRPLYYNTYFRVNSTGYNNNMWGWIGFSLYNANSSTDTNLKRTVIVELLEYDNCTVEMQNSLVTPTNIPNRTTSGYYSSTATGYDNFDFCNNGLRETGDDNTTSISTLYMQYGGDVAANLLCRYQLIFENADHKFVSVYGTDNKQDVTNKTLLTVDFDPNGRIFYHNTSGTTAANANIDPGRLYYTILADLRYSFNVTSTASATTFTGVRYTPLYLKTEMTAATGMVHVASNQPLVTTLPTQADNYYYIYLGQVHDWYRVMLDRDHPVYYHNGTEIVKYEGKTSVAWTSITGRPTNLNQFTNGPGYVTSSGVTSITLKAGAGITLDTDNTAITSTGTRTISINGVNTSSGSETTCLTAKGTWKAFNNYSLPIAKNDTLGGVKPWYSHTTASTGPTTGSDATAIAVNTIQTTAGRYYAIESDSNGRLFVNVPWTNVNNSYLTSHNNLVKQTAKTSGTFKLLASAQASPSSGTAYEAVYDAKIYMNTAENYLVAGGLVVHDKGTTPIEKATLKWNSGDQALEFIFA